VANLRQACECGRGPEPIAHLRIRPAVVPPGDNDRVWWQELATPIGDLGVAVDDAGLCRVDFRGSPASPGDPLPGDLGPGGDAVLDRALTQLRAYFAGELTDFDLPLSVTGGSPFERAVWRAIAAIPYAQMRTYGEIAADVGVPDGARAVGIACNRNPLPLVVPCHRVVGAGGKLVGFGGGLPRKRFLLALEARIRVERDFSSA
jgi:methylated-DNA-[protein]-cysteine S-methyltransferase